MARFLSAEWVAATNRALEGADEAIAATGSTSLAAAGGRFRVSQLVALGPDSGDGSVRTTLVVEGGRVWLELDEQPGDQPEPPPDVEVILSYDDAAALARGDLRPADALRTGRIRVRGDLSVLMAGQAILQAAADRLGGRHDDTTY